MSLDRALPQLILWRLKLNLQPPSAEITSGFRAEQERNGVKGGGTQGSELSTQRAGLWSLSP